MKSIKDSKLRRKEPKVTELCKVHISHWFITDSYESFIISLNSMPVSGLTVEHVLDWLLNEEM